jgi:hypothetical protein
VRELGHTRSKEGVKKTSWSSAEPLEFGWPLAASQDPGADDLLRSDGEQPRVADASWQLRRQVILQARSVGRDPCCRFSADRGWQLGKGVSTLWEGGGVGHPQTR